MQAQNTLKTVLTDRLWEQAQARESRFHAAQDAARLRAERIADVTSAHDFSRDEANCLFTAQGVCVQCAMKLTNKATGKSLSVVCKLDDAGDQFWFILDMAGCIFDAGDLIGAVQARIAAGRRAN